MKFRTLPSLLAPLGIWLGCGDAHARTIYVAPQGNNAAAGTLSQPVADPARALALAAPNDTILLRGGRYNLARPLYATRAGVSIAAARGETAVFQAPL
jgi:hypothetical protein